MVSWDGMTTRELVTSVLPWEGFLSAATGVLGALEAFLGPRVLVETEEARMPECVHTSERMSLTDAAALVTRQGGGPWKECTWVEVRVEGASGSVLLCNDLDVHVESSDPSMLAAAQAFFDSQAIRWYGPTAK
jgi:hypothetical protein